MHGRRITLIPAALGLIALNASADEFDFELALDYGTSSTSSTTQTQLPIVFDLDQDLDNIDLRGTWYFNGVVANEGPRERAAFLGQASSVSLSYTNLDGSTVARIISSDPNIPSSTDRSSQSGNAFSVDGQYIWNSGWYVIGALASADLEGVDVTAIAAGVGKYFGSRTALNFVVTRADSDNSDSTDVALNLTRVGDLGSKWQYGADLNVSTVSIGNADGSYEAKFSLYPSRDFGFGAGINGGIGSSQFDSTSYSVFANWFPAQHIGLEASYGWVDTDDPRGTQTDSDGFSIGGVYRF